MPAFDYKVRDKYGNLQTGVIDAATEDEAAEILTGRGFVLTGILAKEKKFNLRKILLSSSKISYKEVTIFSRQFSVMIDAGMHIVESLRTLAAEESNIKFAEIIAEIAKDVEGGKTLSASINKYPKVFSQVYISMIRAGENSGKLDTVLLKMADQLEKDNELRSKIKGAMIYPAFILATMSSVGILAVAFLIPRLRPLLESSGMSMPFTTRALIFSSEIVIKWWFLLIPFIILCFYFLRMYFKSAKGSEFWAGFKLKMPILGMITKKIYMARFNRIFSTLISGGVDVLYALEITSDAIGNIHYKKDIMSIIKDIKNGVSLADAFKKSDKFPRLVKQMISVGERTGTLDTTTEKMAYFFETSTENTVNNLSKLLEPVLIVVMGVAVAIMVYSIVVPLYDVTKAIKK